VFCVSLEGYHVPSLVDTDSALGCLTNAGGVVTQWSVWLADGPPPAIPGGRKRPPPV